MCTKFIGISVISVGKILFHFNFIAIRLLEYKKNSYKHVTFGFIYAKCHSSVTYKFILWVKSTFITYGHIFVCKDIQNFIWIYSVGNVFISYIQIYSYVTLHTKFFSYVKFLIPILHTGFFRM